MNLGPSSRTLKAVIKEALRNCGVEIHKIAAKPADIPIHLDYPINPTPRWGHGSPLHDGIAARLARTRARYVEMLERLAQYQSALYDIPLTAEPASASSPSWINRFMEGLDAIALSCILLDRKPSRYVEIGSGNSTKFARHAIERGGLATSITSIDPQPRAEIDSLCDRFVRATLEDSDLSLFEELRAGDLLFYDGSHRVFTNSDATVFFLEVLPRLPAGVLVHIHDIFLPSDYPPEWNARLYSEQYLLAAMLLSSEPGFDIILPVNFIRGSEPCGGGASRIRSFALEKSDDALAGYLILA
jgi:hypothetical protein